MSVTPSRVSSGVSGLDTILDDGLLSGRSYLLRGPPGSGKTILGFHFLTAGAEAGETPLYINLEEPESQVRANATTLGFDIDAVDFLDVTPESDFFAEDQSYSIFEAGEVEEAGLTDRIVERVEALDPDRVFLDPVTQFRYLTSDDYQFRKQVISFLRFLKERDATVLFTSQRSQDTPDDDLQFLADGVIELDQTEYGRTVTVPKFRGSDRQAGTHAMRIDDAGISVAPELVPEDHQEPVPDDLLESGVDGLDSLLGGGLERGTITIVSGPTGVGKTTTGALFAQAAAARGERAALYLFEESEATFRHRSAALGIPVDERVDDGSMEIHAVEPLTMAAEEFAADVRDAVENRGVEFLLLDGVDGYTLSLRGAEDGLVRKLHALGRYCKNMGVTVVLVDELDTVTGDFQATEAGVSYLSDNIVFLRHVEMGAELRTVVGVLKKRMGTFERTLREFELSSDGVAVGDPLEGVQGILRGTPSLRTPRDEGG